MKRELLLSVLLLSCSSTTSVTRVEVDGGGEIDAAGASGEAGSAGSLNGTGGSGGVDDDSGMSAGAAGEGGESGKGSGGTGPCVPKTCDTFSYEKTGEVGRACGIIPDDGCGNVLNCGNNCPEYQACETADWGSDAGVANICGGGCTILDSGIMCTTPLKYTMCKSNGYNPPFNDCTHISAALPTQYWCCP